MPNGAETAGNYAGGTKETWRGITRRGNGNAAENYAEGTKEIQRGNYKPRHHSF